MEEIDEVEVGVEEAAEAAVAAEEETVFKNLVTTNLESIPKYKFLYKDCPMMCVKVRSSNIFPLLEK